MSEIISIIVPVYNAERTLCECVDSILVQTYPYFELLLIDDGSKDKSGTICDAYAEKDSRVRVFHKSNGGVSSARNLGIDNIGGGYLTFVDSDDIVKPQYLEHLYLGSMNGKADYVVGGYQMFGIFSDCIAYQDRQYEGIQIKECLHQHIAEFPFTGPWTKLFRAEIIHKYHIRFDTCMACAEDSCFNKDYLLYTEYISLVGYSEYCYRCEDGTYKYGADGKNTVYAAQQTIQKLEKLANKYETSFSYIYPTILSYHQNRFYFYLLTKLRIIASYREFIRTYRILLSYNFPFILSGGKAQRIFLNFVNHRHLFLAYCLVKSMALFRTLKLD